MVSERIGYFRGGLSLEGDSRPFAVQNYHCKESLLNVSLTLGRTVRGGGRARLPVLRGAPLRGG